MGVGLGKVGEKILDKEMVRDDVDVEAFCDCTFKYAKKHWNSFEEYKNDRSSKKEDYGLQILPCYNKYIYAE